MAKFTGMRFITCQNIKIMSFVIIKKYIDYITCRCCIAYTKYSRDCSGLASHRQIFLLIEQRMSHGMQDVRVRRGGAKVFRIYDGFFGEEVRGERKFMADFW